MLEQLFTAMRQNNQDALKALTSYLAIAIRNEMEDFHIAHLNDKQMAELNPIIRKAIYNALFAFSNAHRSAFCDEWVQYVIKTIPAYWEDPQLISDFKKINDNMAQSPQNDFRSAFLTEQLLLGNILFDPITQCVKIVGSYDFKDVTGNKHAHRDKISAQLRKEGYHYNVSLAGYVKKISW